MREHPRSPVGPENPAVSLAGPNGAGRSTRVAVVPALGEPLGESVPRHVRAAVVA